MDCHTPRPEEKLNSTRSLPPTHALSGVDCPLPPLRLDVYAGTICERGIYSGAAFASFPAVRNVCPWCAYALRPPFGISASVRLLSSASASLLSAASASLPSAASASLHAGSLSSPSPPCPFRVCLVCCFVGVSLLSFIHLGASTTSGHHMWLKMKTHVDW